MSDRFLKILIDHSENEWRFIGLYNANGAPYKVIKQIPLENGLYELTVHSKDD